MSYTTHDLPNFVKEYFGGFKQKIAMDKFIGGYRFTGGGISVVVYAETVKQAKGQLRSAVVSLSGRSDGRCKNVGGDE